MELAVSSHATLYAPELEPEGRACSCCSFENGPRVQNRPRKVHNQSSASDTAQPSTSPSSLPYREQLPPSSFTFERRRGSSPTRPLLLPASPTSLSPTPSSAPPLVLAASQTTRTNHHKVSSRSSSSSPWGSRRILVRMCCC
jgi:hypothetical protein